MRKKAFKTIREAAEDLLMRVSYVDVYGRRVGLTYKAIIAQLHILFPSGRTSLRSLRMIKCNLNRSQLLLPARRRSSKVLARDFARALLIALDKDNVLTAMDDKPRGYSLKRIAHAVRRKFPEYSMMSAEQLSGLSIYLSKQKFNLPPRPED